MKNINLSMTIGEVLEKYPEKGEILAEKFDMVCLGCPHSQMETLKEAAEHHGVDTVKLLKELNSKSEIRMSKSETNPND